MNIHIKTLGSTDRNRFILLAVVFGIIKTFNSHYFFFFYSRHVIRCQKSLGYCCTKSGYAKDDKGIVAGLALANAWVFTPISLTFFVCFFLFSFQYRNRRCVRALSALSNIGKARDHISSFGRHRNGCHTKEKNFLVKQISPAKMDYYWKFCPSKFDFPGKRPPILP